MRLDKEYISIYNRNIKIDNEAFSSCAYFQEPSSFERSSRMTTNTMDDGPREFSILNGPSKFDMLLSQYDHPRPVRFQIDYNGTPKMVNVQIKSATLQRQELSRVRRLMGTPEPTNEDWIIAGLIEVGGAGGGTNYLPMMASYSPLSRKGVLTWKHPDKGIIVINIRCNGTVAARI